MSNDVTVPSAHTHTHAHTNAIKMFSAQLNYFRLIELTSTQLLRFIRYRTLTINVVANDVAHASSLPKLTMILVCTYRLKFHLKWQKQEKREWERRGKTEAKAFNLDNEKSCRRNNSNFHWVECSLWCQHALNAFIRFSIFRDIRVSRNHIWKFINYSAWLHWDVCQCKSMVPMANELQCPRHINIQDIIHSNRNFISGVPTSVVPTDRSAADFIQIDISTVQFLVLHPSPRYYTQTRLNGVVWQIWHHRFPPPSAGRGESYFYTRQMRICIFTLSMVKWAVDGERLFDTKLSRYVIIPFHELWIWRRWYELLPIDVSCVNWLGSRIQHKYRVPSFAIHMIFALSNLIHTHCTVAGLPACASGLFQYYFHDTCQNLPN